jgi:hypothetical protein
MANEFIHLEIGSILTEAEYDAVGAHVMDSQAIGDMIYASTTGQLSRLAPGTAGQAIIGTCSSCNIIPAWTTILAAQSDQETGTSTTVYVTPGRQQFHQSAAKGWVNDNTNSSTANASYNVSGVVSGCPGLQTVSWATDFSSDCYSVFGSAYGGTPYNFGSCACSIVAGSFIARINNLSCACLALTDREYGAAAFGDQ